MNELKTDEELKIHECIACDGYGYHLWHELDGRTQHRICQTCRGFGSAELSYVRILRNE